MKSPEINPRIHGQTVFDKGNKNIQGGKDSVLNKWWEIWIFTYEIMKLGSYLTPLTRINSKWI